MSKSAVGESAFTSLANKNRSSEETATAVRTLAEESRGDSGVRQRLASSENLTTLIDIITEDVLGSATEFAIRCIGNACADNDEGRANVTNIGFGWANRCLDSSSVDGGVKMIVSKALFNICTDYEPAQQACYRSRVHYGLIRFCGTAFVGESEDASLVIDLIFYVCGQKANLDAALQEKLPVEVLLQLIELPRSSAGAVDVETFASLVESVLVFLRDTTIQTQLLESDRILSCWQILQTLDSKIADLDPSDPEDEEDLKLLIPLSASLTWCLSDIAALPGFSTTYGLDSPLIHQLLGLVGAKGRDQSVNDQGKPRFAMLTAACQVVGNLLWALPPEKYEYLVNVDRLHGLCFDLILQSHPSTATSELLHALAGLLIQLTRPSIEIRDLIGSEDKCHAALQKLSEQDVALIKQDAVKLIKVLGKDCPANQERFGELAKDILVALQDGNEQNPSA